MSAEANEVTQTGSKGAWPDSWQLLSHGIRKGRYTERHGLSRMDL
jgi:hypothetical protein